MIIKNRKILFVALIIINIFGLFAACNSKTADIEPPETNKPILPSIKPESPSVTFNEEMIIRISPQLEEGYSAIIIDKGETQSEGALLNYYLYVDSPIYDVVINNLVADQSPMDFYDIGNMQYLPVIEENQAFQLFTNAPEYYGDSEKYCKRISYTESNGNFHVALLTGEKDSEPILTPIESDISKIVYPEHYNSFDLFSEKFKEKMSEGIFDSYIPKGFCIAGGSLGDVNSDGIADALIYLTFDGTLSSFSDSLLMFVLIGQPSGEYLIEKRLTDTLFAPYRSSSNAEAGEGYIDIVYDYVSGAACHHTQVCRFLYNPDKEDWFMESFSYQPAFAEDYKEIIPPNFVNPLPDFANLSLEEFSHKLYYYNSLPDWDYFDKTTEFSIPSYSEYNDIYTLAIKLNANDNSYDGYIYKYYESLESGGFIQTLHGEYNPNREFALASNSEEKSFTVQDDIWQMNIHDEDSFHLVK